MAHFALGIITGLEIIFALASAYFWLLSALVKFPKRIRAYANITTYPESPEAWDPSIGMIGGEVESHDLQRATNALHRQGNLNMWAAICMGITSTMQAVVTIAALLGIA